MQQRCPGRQCDPERRCCGARRRFFPALLQNRSRRPLELELLPVSVVVCRRGGAKRHPLAHPHRNTRLWLHYLLPRLLPRRNIPFCEFYSPKVPPIYSCLHFSPFSFSICRASAGNAQSEGLYSFWRVRLWCPGRAWCAITAHAPSRPPAASGLPTTPR